MSITNKMQRNNKEDNEKLIYGSDLSKYGKDFQVKLLSLLIKDRMFSINILPIIKDEYFSDIFLRKIFICIKEYITQWPSSPPTIDNLKILLQNKKEKIVIYEKILTQIDEVELTDRDFVIDNAQRFCFSKHALSETEKQRILLEEGRFEEAQKISLEAFKHSGLSSRKIYDLKEDYEKIFQDDLLHRPIELPFPTINKCSKGGPGAGNLVISVAPSNLGKTALLTAFSRHANSLGKNVAFFSFEIGGIDIIRRYLAGSIEVKQEELKYNKTKVKDKIIDSTLGNFRLIEQRATSATVEQIRADLEYLKSTGFFPEVIMVDSLNQLKVRSFRPRDDNEKFEYIAEELRDLANDYGIPCHTVFQTNRQGFTNEVNDIMSIGKAIEPFQVADMLMTLAQKPEMAAENKVILLLLKNRLGPKNIVLECFYDPNMGIFKELREVPELLMLNSTEKKQVQTTVSNMREKLKSGDFSKKR